MNNNDLCGLTVLYARHSVKRFPSIVSFNPTKPQKMLAVMVPPFTDKERRLTDVK